MSPAPAERLDEWMGLALAEAALAESAGEVPVGAVVVSAGGEVIATGQNRRERDNDPAAHAEIVAMRAAGAAVGSWRLEGCTVVVTLEPCVMCAGAMVNGRVARVVYGADDPKAGAVRSLMRVCEDARLNHRLEVVGGVAAEACGQQLRAFFRRQRDLGKK